MRIRKEYVDVKKVLACILAVTMLSIPTAFASDYSESVASTSVESENMEPRLEIPFNLAGMQENSPREEEIPYAVSSGTNMRFGGSWSPSNADLSIEVLRYDPDIADYYVAYSNSRLQSNEEWSLGRVPGGNYKIIIETDYPITSGFLYATV